MAPLWVVKRVPSVDRDVKLERGDGEGNEAEKIVAHEAVPVIDVDVDRFVGRVLRAHGELFVPVWVEGLLDDLRLLRAVELLTLLTGHTNLDFTERIAQPKGIGSRQVPGLNAPHSHRCVFIHFSVFFNE